MKLNFRTFGEGHPVIILHGLFGMLDNWQTFAKRLADDGNKVYIIDQRDHGKSPHTKTFNYQILAEDLAVFLEEQNLKKVSIIGHSMGGKAAMKFAKNYSEKLESLIVVDIAPKKYIGSHEMIIEALLGLDFNIIESRKEIFTILNEKLGDEGIVYFLMKNIGRNSDGNYGLKMNLELLKANYLEIMAGIDFNEKIDTPTLFIRGGTSSYILDDDWLKLQETFTNVELKTVYGSGHWIHAENPDELLKIITNFIKQ